MQGASGKEEHSDHEEPLAAFLYMCSIRKLCHMGHCRNKVYMIRQKEAKTTHRVVEASGPGCLDGLGLNSVVPGTLNTLPVLQSSSVSLMQ